VAKNEALTVQSEELTRRRSTAPRVSHYSLDRALRRKRPNHQVQTQMWEPVRPVRRMCYLASPSARLRHSLGLMAEAHSILAEHRKGASGGGGGDLLQVGFGRYPAKFLKGLSP